MDVMRAVDEGCGCGGGRLGAVADRREFLKGAGVVAAGLLIALGAGGGDAAAAVVQIVRGVAAGGEVRYPVPAADGASIDREREIILVRWQGKVYAFNLSCPHQHTALRWEVGDGRFQCPKHHSKYQPDGSFVSGRATRGMDRFALRVEGGQVVVDDANILRQDQDAVAWAGAVATVA